jgi:hypothetical protein
VDHNKGDNHFSTVICYDEYDTFRSSTGAHGSHKFDIFCSSGVGHHDYELNYSADSHHDRDEHNLYNSAQARYEQ